MALTLLNIVVKGRIARLGRERWYYTMDDNLDNYVIFSAPLKTIGATFFSQTSENG